MSEHSSEQVTSTGPCQKCWDEAFFRMQTLGGSQAEHYSKLLRENEGKDGHE